MINMPNNMKQDPFDAWGDILDKCNKDIHNGDFNEEVFEEIVDVADYVGDQPSEEELDNFDMDNIMGKIKLPRFIDI